MLWWLKYGACSVPFTLLAGFFTPASASGGWWCEIDDANLKLDMSTGLTRGAGNGTFNFEARAEVRLKDIAPEFRSLVLDKALTQSWLDRDEAKLEFYVEAEKNNIVSSVTIEIETDSPSIDDEGGYQGTYRLSYDARAFDSDAENKEVTGKATCSAE
jgi:hypothetical protein